MTHQQSFTRIEKELLPQLRKRLNEAESTEDVKKFFAYCLRDLFIQVLPGRPEADLDELVLLPGGAPPFQLGEGLGSAPGFAEAWATSDLPQIVTRFAEAACHRHRHLEKNLEKTEAKIRM